MDKPCSAAGTNELGVVFLLNLSEPRQALTDTNLGWKLLPYCNRFPHLSRTTDDSQAN